MIASRVCAALLLVSGLSSAAFPETRPNVVLIMSDDMGYGDLGAYGAPDVRTPSLDRLASQGVRFTDFYAAATVCTPTRAALMTGRYQQRVGLEWAIVTGDRRPGLPRGEPSIAKLLRDRGYATGIFGKWHLGEAPPYRPSVHGFDEFFGFLGGNVDMYSHRNVDGLPELYDGDAAVTAEGYLTDLISDRSVGFIEKHRSRPFFLYVAYNAVHWPYQPPNRPDDVRDRTTWYRGTRDDYRGMLEAMDAGIGRILGALDRYGLAGNTLVIFTNDNGGESLSRGVPLFHRKHSLYEGGIRVPCIVRWPGRARTGLVATEPAITMDLTATIAEAAGATAPDGKPFDGRSLAGLLNGGAWPQARTFFWRIDRPSRQMRAVRRGPWKLVRDTADWFLYDVVEDPGERLDQGYQHPDVVADLRRALEAWEAEMARETPQFRVR